MVAVVDVLFKTLIDLSNLHVPSGHYKTPHLNPLP